MQEAAMNWACDYGWRRQGMRTKFWWGYLLGNIHLEGRELGG